MVEKVEAKRPDASGILPGPWTDGDELRVAETQFWNLLTFAAGFVEVDTFLTLGRICRPFFDVGEPPIARLTRCSDESYVDWAIQDLNL